MTIPVSVIIPVLNQWPLTERCLRTLAEHSSDLLEIIVVDNASIDDTPRSCPILGDTLFGERFAYLRQETNLNFGPACNLGASKARGDFLFLLNNDTELRPGWLPPLLTALENQKIGAVGPRLLYPNGRVQHVGIVFTPQLTPTHLFEHFPGNHPAVLTRRRCQAITAAAMLLPTSLFRDLSGFFEGFRNGSEDLDLCARIRAKGLQLAICPESVVIHHAGSSGGRFDHDDANATLLRSRQAHAFTPDLHLFARQAGYVLCLNSWLVPYLSPLRTPTPKNATGLDTTTLRQILNSEPLWESGYELLANAAIVDDDAELALETRYLQCQFFPESTHYNALHQLARQTGRSDLAQDVGRKIQYINERLACPLDLTDTAKKLAAHFRVSGQSELYDLYQNWSKKSLHKSTISL